MISGGIDSLSAVRLSTFGLRREPPRPIEDRPAGYEALFDFDTLFYDVFRAADSRQVICLGPPLLNCAPALSQLIVRLPGTDAAVHWEYLPPRSQRQPSAKILLTGADIATAESVILEIAGCRTEIPIQSSGSPRLRERRVIVTLSKDNPLAWICDWAQFNARVHGADAVLFYDNGSQAYDLAQLRGALETVPGVAEILVVPWRFPYGPGVGPRNVQDSFYCQPGTLENARRRYCPAARGVLNTDIDELAVLASGGSIFARAEASGKAAMVFPGLWTESDAPAAGLVRHSDCLHSERWRAALHGVLPFRRLLRTKWIVLPGRCPADADWGVHDLYPASPQMRLQERSWKWGTRDPVFRHFRPINTGWKPLRRRGWRYSPIAYGYDRDLARAFAIAFPDRKIAPPKSGLLRSLARPFRRRAK